MVRVEPTRSNVPSCSTRSSLACTSMPSSPISSRNSVPPCAASNRPARVATAPVNAPFSWPNSSLSISVAGMAAQLTRTNARPLRGLRWCSARASSSLPVPVSPSSRTAASVGATCDTRASTWRMARLWPTISSKSCVDCTSSRSETFSSCKSVAQRADLVEMRDQLGVAALAIEGVGQDLADDPQPVHVDRRPLAGPREVRRRDHALDLPADGQRQRHDGPHPDARRVLALGDGLCRQIGGQIGRGRRPGRAGAARNTRGSPARSRAGAWLRPPASSPTRASW